MKDCKLNVGDVITIHRMAGEPQYAGKSGIVRHIDSIGQIHGTWGGLALQPDVDEFSVTSPALWAWVRFDADICHNSDSEDFLVPGYLRQTIRVGDGVVLSTRGGGLFCGHVEGLLDGEPASWYPDYFIVDTFDVGRWRRIFGDMIAPAGPPAPVEVIPF